jgi:hypothetical protein
VRQVSLKSIVEGSLLFVGWSSENDLVHWKALKHSKDIKHKVTAPSSKAKGKITSNILTHPI